MWCRFVKRLVVLIKKLYKSIVCYSYMITTVQIRTKVRDRLEGLKTHPRESFNDVIERLINSQIDDEPLTDEDLKEIEAGLEDIKAGRIISHEDLKRKLGL